MPPYDRLVAIEKIVILVAESSKTLKVEHLKFLISSQCGAKINLRQGSTALAFAVIKNGLSSATVSIDTTRVSLGVYTLTLESFDSSESAPQATL